MYSARCRAVRNVRTVRRLGMGRGIPIFGGEQPAVSDVIAPSCTGLHQFAHTVRDLKAGAVLTEGERNDDGPDGADFAQKAG